MNSQLIFGNTDTIPEESLTIEISDDQDAYSILEQLEQNNIQISQDIKIYLLSKGVEEYKHQKEKRAALDKEFNDAIASKRLLNEKIDASLSLQGIRESLTEQLKTFEKPSFNRTSFNNIKLQKLQARLAELMPQLHHQTSQVSAKPTFDSSTQASGTPILSLAFLQSVILLPMYLLSSDERIMIVGLAALVLQLLLSVWVNYAEVNDEEFLAMLRYNHPETNLEDVQNDDLDNQIVNFVVYDALEQELDKVNQKLSHYFDGKSVEEVSKIQIKLDEKLQQLDNKLTNLENSMLGAEMYLERRRILDTLSVGREEMPSVVQEKIQLRKPLIVNHVDSEDKEYIQNQYNLLLEVIDGVVIYISDAIDEENTQEKNS